MNKAAADTFVRLRKEGVRVGTMDLKIASISLVHDATLLTRNGGDFGKVHGLRFDNWLW
jgi:tRNA(fMet)-specific endonuclease VapC